MDARLDDGWEAIDDLDPMMGGGWWDDHNRGLMDLHQLRDLFGDDQDMGVFHGFDHHMAGQNEWNDNAHLQRQRVQQIASKIPTVILQESPTLQMYLAIQTNNLPKLKEAIEKGAVLENEFQSYRLMDMNGLRDRDGEAENRNPVKNPLEYALDCVTLNSLRDRVQNFEDFKNRLYNDTSKFLFEKYPHYVTKKYVKKLTTFLDYALQLIRQNNRRNNPNPPNENENRQHRFKLADLFDENFFDNMKPEAKQRCVERLFEAMFFPVEMKNIRHLDFFIENGINIGTYRVENGWGEAKTLTESVLNDFLLKIKGAFSYVVARTQLMQPNQIGFRNRISRHNRSGGTDWPSEHRELFLSNYRLPIKKLMKQNISMDVEIHEFRINLRSDTFLNHTTDLLIRCHQKQEKIRKSLDDIHLTQPGQLAKLQDDYLKISEINRLLGDAIEGVLENNVRLGLKLDNYHYCHLMMALAQFGILKHNRLLRKEMILGLVLRSRNEMQLKMNNSDGLDIDPVD